MNADTPGAMEQPKRIGKYELREFLGGGMSHVYRAWDPVMSRTVAVKILTENSASDPEAKARFLREARTAGSLSHDNIIRVYDFGEEQGRPYMVMEFLQGEDLRQAINGGHTGDLRNRLRIAIEVAKALEYVHEQAIVYRDIKPENIHVDTVGRVRLMDFGIAKRQEFNLTRAGFTLGTPYYMSPEQVLGKDVTHLADVYAFGILLFELLTGAKPITGESIEQLFYRILNEPLDLEPLRGADVPEPLCNFIGSCTAKAPGERPESFTVIRRETEQALRELDGAAKPSEPGIDAAYEAPAGPRPPWVIPTVAVALLIALTVSYFAFRSPPAPEPEPEPVAPPLTAVLSTPTGEMMLVPEGEFLSGADKEVVHLPPFYIDKTEVTNAAYARFCAERSRPLPRDFPENQPDHPVVNITFAEAQEYARWAGKRLPAKHEWEKAARGSDGRLYPWGNEPDTSRANVANNSATGSAALLPAESFSRGASPFNVLQMAGNVWELVDESITPSPGALRAFANLLSPPPTASEPWCTICGGSYDIPLVENASYEWSAVPARYRATNIGFRCAKDPP